MKKTLITLSLITSLGLGDILVETAPAMAAETKSSTSSEIESVNNKINNLEKELEKASLELEKVNLAINDTQKEINNINQQITDKKENIESLQTEINKIIERIESRNDVLKERARSLQESGGVISYLEVLLGAQSFSDFINRTEAVLTIVGADKSILQEHQNDKELVDEAKNKLETELLTLETSRTELKTKEESLVLTQQEQEVKEKDILDKVKVLEREKKELMAKNIVVSNPQTKNTQISTQVKSTGNSSFIWPTIGGVVTSYQGPRWGRYHKGIDTAAPSDYAILAASGGTVSYSGWMNGYGKTVKVEHSNGYSTRYSHLDSINVDVGQSLAQGSQIGIMGSTGRSTGIHLDFEVYRNGSLLNPIDVLPKR